MLSSCGYSADFGKKSSSSVEDITTKESENTSANESTEPVKEHYNILFIGNSFTYYNDLDKITETIGKEAGLDIKCSKISKGSQTLLMDTSSTDEVGKQIINALNSDEDYTHIILQEHSTTPVNNYNNFLKGAQGLATSIRDKKPNAKIVLYETWGFEDFATSKGKTIPEVEGLLRDAYNNAAKEIGASVDYVGKAFTYVYENYKNLNLYHLADNKHPSFLGSYLSALVHLKTITNADLSNIKFTGTKGQINLQGEENYISPEDLEIIKNVAKNN